MAPTGSGVGLDQTVIDKMLVDEKRVQRGGIEAGQEHVDDEGKVDLAHLQALGQVL